MKITETLHATDRTTWRHWLAEYHDKKSEIWLVSFSAASGKPRLLYLHAVEEALCFGWIDGIAKKLDADRSAQRFTPRRPNSNWTELNKERARRLIAQGEMTEAGRATLPDLSPDAFRIADDVLAALKADATVWHNFQNFPDLYKRIRVGYIEEMRKQPAVFKSRLDNFIKKTYANKQFGVLT